MTRGDRVRVYAHGSPAQTAAGWVVVASSNGTGLALELDAVPPWVTGLMVLPLVMVV
jgi:hypothetical protein